MSAEKCGRDRNRSPLGQARAAAQLLALGVEVETVARLHFDRRRAFGDQGVQPRQRPTSTSASSLAARVALIVERIPPPARAISS